MVEAGDQFPSIAEAKVTVTRWLLDSHLSYFVFKTDSKRLMLRCEYAKAGDPESPCSFNIRVTYSKKVEAARVTVMEPHICSPVAHFHNRASNSVRYLKEHHRAAVVDHRSVTPSKLERSVK